MLILDSELVSYCQVCASIAGQKQQKAGLIYQDSVFLKVKSFPKAELNNAIKHCREEYLDNQDIEIPILIIKEETAVTLWLEDNRFKPLQSLEPLSQPIVQPKATKFNFKQLVVEMRGKNGLNIKTRTHNLKLFHHSFIGSEAVDWLTQHLGISRSAAVNLGQKLIDKKIIHHVLDEQPFKDESLYYRFYADEGKSIWTDKII